MGLPLSKHVKHRYGKHFQLPQMALGHYEAFSDLIVRPRKIPPGRLTSMTEIRQLASRTGYWREGAFICALDIRGKTACAHDPSAMGQMRREMNARANVGWNTLPPPPYSSYGMTAPIVPPDYYGNDIVSPATTDIFGWRTRTGKRRKKRRNRFMNLVPFLSPDPRPRKPLLSVVPHSRKGLLGVNYMKFGKSIRSMMRKKR